MEPEIFMDDFSRDAEADAYFAVIGRALAFAERFEGNCRNLARILAIRMNPEILAEPIDRQAEFVRKAGKKHLAAHLQTFVPFFVTIPGADIKTLLDGAREARNEIAHEAALGAIDSFRQETSRHAIIENLAPLIRRLALADRVICVALSSVTNEPVPGGEFLTAYEDQVANWVLNTMTAR